MCPEPLQRISSWPLLIGGDISSSKELEECFYNNLRAYWHGPIIGILGNHELWDYYDDDGKSIKQIDEIVEDYRKILDQSGCILLHNDLLICRGEDHWSLIKEREIIKLTACGEPVKKTE